MDKVEILLVCTEIATKIGPGIEVLRSTVVYLDDFTPLYYYHLKVDRWRLPFIREQVRWLPFLRYEEL